MRQRYLCNETKPWQSAKLVNLSRWSISTQSEFLLECTEKFGKDSQIIHVRWLTSPGVTRIFCSWRKFYTSKSSGRIFIILWCKRTGVSICSIKVFHQVVKHSILRNQILQNLVSSKVKSSKLFLWNYGESIGNNLSSVWCKITEGWKSRIHIIINIQKNPVVELQSFIHLVTGW